MVHILCGETSAATQWGCYDKNPSWKRRKKKRGLIKRKNWTKQKYKPRKRYFRKKRIFKKINQNEKCTCYNCGEKGHKSYECNKKRVKISKIDRIDIESDIESITYIQSNKCYEEIFEEFSDSSSEYSTSSEE